MFTGKKIFLFKDYMIFILLILYFCFCYFAVERLGLYSVTEKADPVYANPGNIEAETTAVSDTEEKVPLITDTRTLKEYKGAIGIFDCFGGFIGSFDIDISLLPYEDRKSLEKGIVFTNENEMLDFLESLDS